jgi:hypothetical protein
MPRRKKGAVRPGHGARCLICGRECGKGGSLRMHVQESHHVDYNTAYKRCFRGGDAVLDKFVVDTAGDFLVHIRVLKISAPQPAVAVN